MWYRHSFRCGIWNKLPNSFLTQTLNLNVHKVSSSFSSYYDYESMLMEVETKVPPNFNFARDVIDRHAKDPNIGNKLAFYYVSNDENITKWTFKDLSEESKRFASSLSSFGSINRAILILPKVPEWWILNVAALRNNTVLMPVYLLPLDNKYIHFSQFPRYNFFV